MRLEMSPQGRAVYDRVKAFFDAEILPRNRDWHSAVKVRGEREPDFVFTLRERAKAQGLWNLAMPALEADEPGTALSHFDYGAVAEMLGWAPWSSRVFNCQWPDVPNMFALRHYATPWQREAFLKPMLEGTARSAFAMTEPDVASADATNIDTRIERTGDGYVINGRKWFCTGAAHPDCRFLIVLGRSGEGERTSSHSAVLVPMEAPGLQVLRTLDFLGFEDHGAAPAELSFENVRVPAENLLGPEGAGFQVSQVRLAPARVHHCMRAIGNCEMLIELMKARAAERRTFGRQVIEYDAVQHAIANSRVELEAARLLVQKTAWLLDVSDDRAARQEISMCKVLVARVYQDIADRAIQIFGAMGGTKDTPLADAFAWARGFRIGDGPDEVHLRQIFRIEPPAAVPLAQSPYIVPFT